MSRARVSRWTTLRFLLVAFVVIVPLAWTLWTVHAANRKWTGNGANSNWMTAANWSTGVAPVAGDDLLFPSSAARLSNTNNFPSGTTFDSIEFTGNGYTLSGNSIALDAGVADNVTPSGNTIVNLPIKLNLNQTFSAANGRSLTFGGAIDTNGKLLTIAGTGSANFDGVISGTGGRLTITGSGTVTLTAGNDYTGNTTVSSGTLRINGSQSNSAVKVDGGTLTGGGITGPLTATDGAISPGRDTSDTVFTANGNVKLGPSLLFLVARQDSSGPFGQLSAINGTVDLNNSLLGVIFGTTLLAAGETITLIDNAGSDAIIGTFNGLPEGSVIGASGSTVYISYRGGTGNDVVLHRATTSTWNGAATNSNWMTPANWVGGVAPAVGDDLVFPETGAQKSNNNNFSSDTTFNNITISGSGYTLGGNALRVNGTLNNNNQGGENNAIDLSLNGPGALVTNTATFGRRLTLSGNNTYTGQTEIASGMLFVNGSQPGSPVTVTTAGWLLGFGTVGPLTASGKVEPESSNNPPDNTLTVNGNVSFGATADYIPTLRTVAGIQDSVHLNVNGTVALNSCDLFVTGHFGAGFPQFPAGENYVIINNDGTDAVSGTFSNKPEGSTFTALPGNPHETTLGITYLGGDGNDVMLHVPTIRTWKGGGWSNLWTDAANWVGDVAPGPGDTLIFPEVATLKGNFNNFPPGTTFNQISLSGGGYTLSGNGIGLNTGVSDTTGDESGEANIVNLAIKLNSPQTFSCARVGRFIFFNGGLDTNGVLLTLDSFGHSMFNVNPITGAGGIRVNSEATLNADNTYSGQTTVSAGGLLRIHGHQPNSPVTLSGGSFAGGGTTGPIVASAGRVSPGGIQTSSMLTVNGSITLDQDSTFFSGVQTVGGVEQFRQLNINGAVTLGGATLTVTQFATLPAGDTFVIISNNGTAAINGIFKNLPEGSTFTSSLKKYRISYVGGDGNDVTLTTADSVVRFSASSYTIGEEGPRVDVNITRSGDTTGVATVNFAGSDWAGAQNCNVANGAASSRCDYVTRTGVIQFAAGETSKTVPVFIIDDSYLEGPETLTVSLSKPSGAVLGSPQTATVTIVDNEIANGPNPIVNADFFVRQHYLDFFTREPDAPGFAFWTGELNSCGTDPACISLKRVNVSGAFYLSIEFQKTGYLVERLYKAAYGDATGTSTLGGNHTLPVPIVRLEEFLPDTQQIGLGVVVGQPNWESVLETNKNIFAFEFVQRSRFTTAFPVSMSPALFVDTLNLNAGNPLSQLERDELVSDLSAGAKTRAQVLRAVAEDSDLTAAESNRAFVLMQFFGYLRRNPNDPQDTDYTGYDFWLTKLNQFNGRFVDAEMVKAFITSGEYRQRFGP